MPDKTTEGIWEKNLLEEFLKVFLEEFLKDLLEEYLEELLRNL